MNNYEKIKQIKKENSCFEEKNFKHPIRTLE